MTLRFPNRQEPFSKAHAGDEALGILGAVSNGQHPLGRLRSPAVVITDDGWFDVK